MIELRSLLKIFDHVKLEHAHLELEENDLLFECVGEIAVCTLWPIQDSGTVGGCFKVGLPERVELLVGILSSPNDDFGFLVHEEDCKDVELVLIAGLIIKEVVIALEQVLQLLKLVDFLRREYELFGYREDDNMRRYSFRCRNADTSVGNGGDD